MRHRVLLLFSAGFASGIAITSYIGYVTWIAAALFGIVAILLTLFFDKLAPFAIVVLGIALGALRFCTFFPPGWTLEQFAGPAPVTIVGTIVSDPNQRPSETIFLLRSQEIITHQGVVMAEGTTDVLVHGAAFVTLDDPRLGDTLKVSGVLQRLVPATDPGEFDWRTRMVRRGIGGELVVQRPKGALLLSRPETWSVGLSWAAAVDQKLESAFNANLPRPEAALLAGILFGHRDLLSPSQQQQFLATGTAHILATAGLHVGILALTLSWIIRMLPIPRKVGALLIILLLWGFVFLAGGRPAVVRAVIAATLFYCAYIFERIPDIPSTLATAALGLLAVQPTLLFENDFQLSFVTVAGLAVFMPRWEQIIVWATRQVEKRSLRIVIRPVLELAGLSLIAQICSAPLIAYYFNQFSILSLPVNLIVVPLLFLIIPTAAAACVLSLMIPSAAGFVIRALLHPLLWIVVHTVSAASSMPICAIDVRSPPTLAVAAFYLVVYGTAIAHPLPRPDVNKIEPDWTPA